jgi:hypothetical protein
MKGTKEDDGDYQFNLDLDEPCKRLLNEENNKRWNGMLVIEIIPRDQGSSSVQIPKNGERIEAYGAWVSAIAVLLLTFGTSHAQGLLKKEKNGEKFEHAKGRPKNWGLFTTFFGRFPLISRVAYQSHSSMRVSSCHVIVQIENAVRQGLQTNLSSNFVKK